MIPAAPDGSSLDSRAELSGFLRSRRDRLRPEDAGVVPYGGRRRVPGLRREELAALAGVSVAYYTRLEQGNAENVSLEVLEAIARALQLTEAERAHLLHLVGPGARDAHRPVPEQAQRVRGSLLDMLAALEGTPTYIWGRRADVLAWNRAAAAVFAPWFEGPEPERNWARIVFLDPVAREVFPDWEAKAVEVVGQLRFYAGGHVEDPRLGALLDDLRGGSEDFIRLWAAHEVHRHTEGAMRLRHPIAGEIVLRYQTLTLPDDPELSVTINYAEPGESSRVLRRLST